MNHLTFTKNTCEYAAIGGQLHILQWLRENNYFLNMHSCMVYAQYHGHQDIVKWLEEIKE